MSEMQNSIWGQTCAFGAGFRFLLNRLWPFGYVDLRETEPASEPSNLATKASPVVLSNFNNFGTSNFAGDRSWP
jgi:hypothetical protein